MHHDKIVKIEKIERRETEHCRQRSFVETVSVDERVLGIGNSQANVHRDYRAAEKQHGFHQQQENRACVESGRFHWVTCRNRLR